MDLSQYNLVVEDLPASNSFELIPEGKYNAIVENAEMKDTRDGTGRFFKLTLVLADDPYRGRKLWTNVNFINKNQKAEDIGKQQLRVICEANNLSGRINNTDQLCNALIEIKVGIRKDEGFEPQNEVRGINPAKKDGPKQMPTPSAYQSAPSTSKPQPQPAKAPMPWKKN